MADEYFETHDFDSLRNRVALWKQEQEAWGAIERKGESMLHLIAAAELALEEGNPQRAEQLARMVEQDLEDYTATAWEEDEDLEDFTATAGGEEDDPESLEDGKMEDDEEPEPEATPSKSKFTDLRDLADHRESQEDDELDSHVEAQIEKVGYESDAILDGSGIAGRILSDKYEEIRALIDRAEAADKAGHPGDADRLLKEAEELL